MESTGRGNPPINEATMGTKKIYEILGIEVSGQLGARETSTRKIDLLKIAVEWSKKYFRVEVNVLSVNEDDENDVEGDELIAAWEDGKKTTK